MSEQEAFEKWAETNNLRYQLQKDENGTYLNPNTYFQFMGWKAATAESNKRIEALDSEIAELKQERNDLNYKCMSRLHEIEALQAHINTLREALEVARDYQFDAVNQFHTDFAGYKEDKHKQYDEDLANTEKAISATPAQSLQAFESEVIEKCAKVCDEYYGMFGTDQRQISKRIRDLKGNV